MKLERQSLKTQIYDLCKQAKYFVTINKINNERCLALFPDRVVGKPKYKNEELSYAIVNVKDKIGVERWHNGEKQTFYPPPHTIRPFIYQDIRLHAHILGIPFDLIVGYNEKNDIVENLLEAIPTPEKCKMEDEKAIISYLLLSAIGQDVLKEVETRGLTEGFNFLCRYSDMVVANFLEDV